MRKYFEPKKKKTLFFFNKKPTATLHLDGDVLEYTALKKRAKTGAELAKDEYLNNNPTPLEKVETKMSVVMDLQNLSFVIYDPDSNTITIVGKFYAMYSNPYSNEDYVQKYEKDNNCFTFAYEFEELDEFLRILNEKKQWDTCNIPLVPVYL